MDTHTINDISPSQQVSRGDSKLTDIHCEFLKTVLSTVNIALNKPAHQLYPILGNDTFDASNAVDGWKSDLLYNGGQCAVSHNNETATLWVDLNDVYSIHHITIYFKTDNVRWGMFRFICTLRI